MGDQELYQVLALRKEAYELMREACCAFKARAYAAEARCAELESTLTAIGNKCEDYLKGMRGASSC